MSAPSADFHYTHFHPQALRNWVNDPNGPFVIHNTYHLFFQYNKDMNKQVGRDWYHLSSTDLLHWKHLPIALTPNEEYDCDGIYSGSATLIPNPKNPKALLPVLSYAVSCNSVIVNAVPQDMDDPYLKYWVKPDYNPVIRKPNSVGDGFRDPTTAWRGEDQIWRQLVACGNGEGTCQFKSVDFVNWTYVGAFHQSREGVMWECPDFFQLPGTNAWVFKASAQTEAGDHDYWTVGSFEEVSGLTKADRFKLASGNDILDGNQRLDHGTFYASKSFYDTPNKRTVLFGWVRYNCTGSNWAGIQSFPRVVKLDPVNTRKIITFPIPEISRLYSSSPVREKIAIPPGNSVILGNGAQLDVTLKMGLTPSTAVGGAINISVRALGSPDGMTGLDVSLKSNSTAGELDGNAFSIQVDEPFVSLRVLVDRSVVETFAQGGRAVVTHPYCRPSEKDTLFVVTNLGVTTLQLDTSFAHVSTANALPGQA